MKNLFKVAALGLALTAGLSACESKSTESTTMETPATNAETTTTTTTDTTMMVAPAADTTAMAPATTTTTTTEETK